jgi:predicted protein tyrosine phosphatase
MKIATAIIIINYEMMNMVQETKEEGLKFKIIDFNINCFDHIDDQGKVCLKRESAIDMTMVTSIPIQEVLSHREIIENSMKNMFVSLVNDKKMKNLLFVCEGNEQRSPSFEKWFKEHRPQYNVRSAGTRSVYFEQISEDILEWADRVFLMDLEQERFIGREFSEFLYKTEVIGCSDQYARESSELIRLIEYWARKRGL